jgi:hypothetical protein
MRKHTWEASVCEFEGSGKAPTYHVTKITCNQRPSSPKPIDEQDTASFSNESNDVIDCLILKSIGAADSNLAINPDTVILDCRNPSHLDRCLQSAANKQAAEGSSVCEEP